MSQQEGAVRRPLSRCARCGREIVSDQVVEHAGGAYCTACVGEALNADRAHRSGARPGSVAIAVVLSLVPGLGQMYNGQLMKGLLVLGGFLLLCISGDQLPSGLQATGIVTLYFWNLFDAYWTARRIDERGLPDLPPLPVEQWDSPSAPAWGVLLILLGVMFLLDNFGLLRLTVERAWAIGLLSLGLCLLLSFALSLRARNPVQEVPHDSTR
jgi:TM2 domain-containing membrane protein YozV